MNKKLKKMNIPTLFLKLSLIVLVLLFFVKLNEQKAKAQTSVDVSSSTKSVVLKDSDGDGILDGEDPHPNVAEIYIVEDENRNGVVDKYEADE